MVSSIIPAYNSASTLHRSVASLLETTGYEPEIIIVNNNSGDKTAEVIQDLVSRYPGRIRSLNCTTQGASVARNVGLLHATGKWIQFLDADDTIAPGKISHQLKDIDSETDWIIGGYRVVSPDHEGGDVLPHDDPWKGLVYGYRIGCTHANLYRKTALEHINGWDETLPDNTDPNLHFELLKSGLRYKIIPEVLSFYHQHSTPGRLSTQSPVTGNLRRIDLLERINDYLKAQRPAYWNTNKDYFQAALVRVLRILATHDLQKAAGQFARLKKAGKLSLSLKEQSILNPQLMLAYRLFGFRGVERLRLLAASTLPDKIKEWIKR